MAFKNSVPHIMLVCAAASSGSAWAGAIGNVGAYSEYLFRGVAQTHGVALQGGLDYAHTSGLYTGIWLSNTDFAGYQAQVKYETDLYGGYAFTAGPLAFDLGALFYYYRDDTRSNTVEYYASVSAYCTSLKLYYTDDYFGSERAGRYLTASYAAALTDSLTLTPQLGYSVGKGPQAFVVAQFETTPDRHYFDYSLTLAKTLGDGVTFTFAVIGTNLKNDDEQLMIGLKKSFNL